MMRYTESSRLLNGDAPKRSLVTSTVNTLKRMQSAFNRPIQRIEPGIKTLNKAMGYADPLVYTTMGLGVYDFIDNNAAGFPNDYRHVANYADMIILPYLLFTFMASCLYFTRDTHKRSSANTAIAMFFMVMTAFHNGVAAASFTEDTIFAFSLDKTDPNGSSPSDSNIDILYNIVSASVAVGLTLGVMTFAEDYVHHYEENGRVFAENLRNRFTETQKNVIKTIYTGARTLLFGSQFNGGTINQATVDIKQYWLNQYLIDVPAALRTAIFVGGHAAGFLLESLLLAVKSEPMKEFIDRVLLILAGAFFLEEYFTDVATSISLDRTRFSSSMEAESNTIIAAKSMAVIATWLTILGGSVALAVNQYRKNAANQEMGHRSVVPVANEEKDQSIESSSSSSTATDPLPRTAPPTPIASSSSHGMFSQAHRNDDIYVEWLAEHSNISLSN